MSQSSLSGESGLPKGLIRENPYPSPMPVFLSDNEARFVKGETFNEAYMKKLSSTIKNKLKVLRHDLELISRNEDLKEFIPSIEQDGELEFDLEAFDG